MAYGNNTRPHGYGLWVSWVFVEAFDTMFKHVSMLKYRDRAETFLDNSGSNRSSEDFRRVTVPSVSHCRLVELVMKWACPITSNDR